MFGFPSFECSIVVPSSTGEIGSPLLLSKAVDIRLETCLQIDYAPYLAFLWYPIERRTHRALVEGCLGRTRLAMSKCCYLEDTENGQDEGLFSRGLHGFC